MAEKFLATLTLNHFQSAAQHLHGQLYPVATDTR